MAVSLPFWIVFQSKDGTPAPVAPRHAADCAAIFSTAQLATAFLVDSNLLSFSMRLMSRPGLPALVERLQGLGLRGFCFDPGVESGGTKILFSELKAQGYL